MYNNIGLPTPRGSGTNGYVQRNISYIGNKQYSRTCYERDPAKAKVDALHKRIDKGILEHERKREVEIKCVELSDMLEEQGYNLEDIENKVNEFRTLLLAQLEEDMKSDIKTADIETLTRFHELKNDKMRTALGINTDYIDGSAFNFEDKKKIAEANKLAREMHEKRHNEYVKQLEAQLKQREKNEAKRETVDNRTSSAKPATRFHGSRSPQIQSDSKKEKRRRRSRSPKNRSSRRLDDSPDRSSRKHYSKRRNHHSSSSPSSSASEERKRHRRRRRS